MSKDQAIAQATQALMLADMCLSQVSPCAWKECHQTQVNDLRTTQPIVLEALHAMRALKAQPAQPDCRTCYHLRMGYCRVSHRGFVCTNGDKYQTSPKVVLWRTA